MSSSPSRRLAGVRGRVRLRRSRRWSIRRAPRPLLLLLAVGALLSLSWDLALPAFQGPDEDTHFAYVQHLAETGEVPSASSGGSAYSSEEEGALVTLNLISLQGDLAARPAWSAADLRSWHEVERTVETSAARSNGAGPNPIAKNPPLYYAAMAIPYRVFLWLPLLKRLFVLRLFNALCYLATIAITWLLAGELFAAARWKQVLAAGAVALEPQLSFMSAVVNADNLLIALASAVLLASVRLVTRGPSLRRVLIASVLTAAAILTHGRGLVTLPVLGVALIAAWARHRPPLLDALRRAAAAAATVGVAFLAYLAFGRGGGGSLYGGQIGELNSGTHFEPRQFISQIYQFYFPRLNSLPPRLGPAYGYKQVFIDTFYGSFGWLEVTFKERTYDVLQVLSAVGLVGLYTAVVARRRLLWRSIAVVAVMLALLFTNLLFLHYVSYRALLSDGGSDPLIVGRYLLPMVSLFGVAIAFTIGSLPRRVGPPVGAIVLALGVLLALGGIGLTATRFYA
ncbi:MAG TPA: DUF2142 domain-containing protein [Solirubrobacteraceae bacterium]|nr:DUF2142 domain-containing protein [Solirubrobacteraceae bacterium]